MGNGMHPSPRRVVFSVSESVSQEHNRLAIAGNVLQSFPQPTRGYLITCKDVEINGGHYDTAVAWRRTPFDSEQFYSIPFFTDENPRRLVHDFLRFSLETPGYSRFVLRSPECVTHLLVERAKNGKTGEYRAADTEYFEVSEACPAVAEARRRFARTMRGLDESTAEM